MEWVEQRQKPMEIAGKPERLSRRGDGVDTLESGLESGLESRSLRMMELEMEIFRLNKLVAELLLKNQELRKAD